MRKVILLHGRGATSALIAELLKKLGADVVAYTDPVEYLLGRFEESPTEALCIRGDNEIPEPGGVYTHTPPGLRRGREIAERARGPKKQNWRSE